MVTGSLVQIKTASTTDQGDEILCCTGHSLKKTIPCAGTVAPSDCDRVPGDTWGMTINFPHSRYNEVCQRGIERGSIKIQSLKDPHDSLINMRIQNENGGAIFLLTADEAKTSQAYVMKMPHGIFILKKGSVRDTGSSATSQPVAAGTGR